MQANSRPPPGPEPVSLHHYLTRSSYRTPIFPEFNFLRTPILFLDTKILHKPRHAWTQAGHDLVDFLTINSRKRVPKPAKLQLRWRTASNRATPVATETFRLLTVPAMGIDTR